MSTLFVIDLDGTCADAHKRFKKAGAEPSRDCRKEYLSWVKRIQNARSLMKDPAVTGMKELVNTLYEGGQGIVYLTGREEHWRKVTLKWLNKNEFSVEVPLFMRPNGCWEGAAEFKERVIKFILKESGCTEVVLVDDDEHDVLRLMCKKNKWTFLKACSGGQVYR